MNTGEGMMIEDRLLDIVEVKRMTNLGRSTIRRLELLPANDPRRFPARSYITPQTPRWSFLAVQEWIARQTKNQTKVATDDESEAA